MDANRQLGVLQLAFQAETEAWGVPYARDFAFVRSLARAPRGPNTGFPYLEVEKRITGRGNGVAYDRADTTDKLGALWTWDKNARGAVFKVLSAFEVNNSLPLMPRFADKTCNYSMELGMYENPFVLDGRERPPYRTCECRAL